MADPAPKSDYDAAYAEYKRLLHAASDAMIESGEALKKGDAERRATLVKRATELNEQAMKVMEPFKDKKSS